MFEKLTSKNLETFKQRYEGTYGFYRDAAGKRLLTQIALVGRDVCIFVDSRGVEYKLKPDVEADIGFEFFPPRSAYYNTDQGAMLATRIAARQFARGVNGKNMAIYLLNGVLVPQRVGFQVLEKLYLKAVPPSEAIKTRDPSKSIALSSQLAIDPATRRVFLLDRDIGMYTETGKEFTVTLNEPELWRTEFQDACRAIGYTANFKG